MAKLQYRYVFEKKGAIAPEQLLENELWIDVGNVVKKGAFDHHQSGGLSSSFESVVTYLDNYSCLKKYIDACTNDNGEIYFHIHAFPDIDCISSVYIIQKMIEQNTFDPEKVVSRKTLDKLLEYVNEIDSGKKKYESQMTLYAYICKLGQGINDVQERSRIIIEEGLKVFELVSGALENSADIDLFKTDLKNYVDIDQLEKYHEGEQVLELARKCYESDKETNNVRLGNVKIWNVKKACFEAVKAAIWRTVSDGEDKYLFARDNDECMLTVYPSSTNEDCKNDISSVIIALNPNFENYRDYSLLPLAEFLEQCEQIEEEDLYRTTGRYKRDHSHSRDKKGHFSRAPFDKTSDPWYISEDESIIDIPRTGTLLPYHRIYSIVKEASYMANGASIVRFRHDIDGYNTEIVKEYHQVSTGDLYKATEELVYGLCKGTSHDYLCAVVKLDASMVRYSNTILKSCCLQMVKKSDTKMTEDNILYVDYRTCIYVDQTITVIVGVDDNNRTWESLIDKNIKDSALILDLKKSLDHRWHLRDIGAGLTSKMDSLQSESNLLSDLNTRLVRLNIQMEEDALIIDPIEAEVYSFVRNVLRLDELKESVTTSANLLIENAEQQYEKEEKKRDERIQAGIGLITIFAIVSALTDAFDFIAKLMPGTEDGWLSLMEYPWLFCLELIFTIAIIAVGIQSAKYVIKAWKNTEES